jgi:hypothetical protein
MDRLLVARVLLTLATLGYGLLTVTADFNKTHATNSLWTGHARFHVVWQIASYVGFGAIALWVIWARAKWQLGASILRAFSRWWSGLWRACV